MSELDIQYDNLRTDSIETDDADLAESITTEQTNELTNTSEETELNTVSLNLREASWVWEHFSKEYNTKNELKSFIYTICRLKYKPTNTPGTLTKHLYNKHNNLVGNRQNTLDKFLPFSIVDNPYFITMLNTFDARYLIPCRQTIRAEILNKYNSMHKIILEELEKPKKVLITCDIWSSITKQSYLGVTVHFINSEWQLRYFLLDLLPLTEQHTAVNIQQAIIQVLD
ncbi:3368_t:CDS:2 [Scutellospora calospora]|uniref:3368_t:CDS:1 n=1 Tax=Scutellospora calospora TaxID=85575 RepID=A0ACA9JVQ1_9GLOM|nr:3368_t:CDS:2 [Scutellospora calospora]